MFDQLVQLVQQHAGQSIINNPAIPDQHNSAAIQDVAQQIFNGLQSHASSGNLQQLVGMFQGSSGNLSSHPIVSQLISSVAGSIASKFGVAPQAAQSMASGLLPTVMNQLVQKTNNPNDNSFDLSSMMGQLSGNSNLDLGSLLGQAGGSNAQSTLGGLGNLLGGLFGK